MKITLLGTGSFVSDLEHMGPGYLLETDDKKILVDTGCGVQIQLIKLGINIYDLDYIFITHFHPDHTVELYSMLVRRYMLSAFYGKDPRPLYVYGPKGIAEFIKGIAKIHQLDLVPQFKEIYFEELVDKMKELDNFSVEAFAVDHLNSDAVSYRFQAEGKKVVFSGDTKLCEGIQKAIQDVDLFITDCSAPKDNPIEPHLLTTEIGEISKKANVKKVVLSHLLPLGYDTDLVSEVKEKFDGEVVLGKDLMELEV
ncbi:MAG: MBL fold metallo-hydrolase [bacterium]|nr:MBL fold metallo-hydrolase [bacterium]